ncbi:MAG TPA: 3-keto-5-aminohexanoate cleavage protein, partial [Woeseiaceae bacterium]|nr:3-keto-5-aminohexanoate cleavage protein [Woeseiaceae bacterium]
VAAIRDACSGVLINMSTGIIGPEVEPVIACLRETRPEIAACNAGSLNYLKTRRDGSWAWEPILFDNPVDKIRRMLDAMAESGTVPEFECFDLGIIRSVGVYAHNGMVTGAPDYNFVCGVASGMPVDPDLLPFLARYRLPDCPWQVTAIGRAEVWDLHRRTAELGGNLRTGLEDCFYLPDGTYARSNGEMVEALASIAEQAGCGIATAQEARRLLCRSVR